MRKTLLACLLFLTLPTVAATAPILLEKASINTKDKATLKRGAQFYARTCMACHSMKYLKHNTLAKEAGITPPKEPLKAAEWWAGVPPPDLSLIARVHSADWLYTYLLSFYKDDSRELGSNNLLSYNSNMPNPFLGMQGEQVLLVNKKRLITHDFAKKPHWYNVLKRVTPGTMSQDAFEQSVNDLVNFLVYASEPIKPERMRLGWWVLGFLVIFAILAFFLKREFWKDVKK